MGVDLRNIAQHADPATGRFPCCMEGQAPRRAKQGGGGLEGGGHTTISGWNFCGNFVPNLQGSLGEEVAYRAKRGGVLRVRMAILCGFPTTHCDVMMLT